MELARAARRAGLAASTMAPRRLATIHVRLSRVLDLKTPGSGEQQRNLLGNIPLLSAHDQVKFVVCDRADYDWASAMVAEHAIASRCEVLFSPSFDQVAPRDLAEWILADRLPVRFQMQLHKQLWGEEKGR